MRRILVVAPAMALAATCVVVAWTAAPVTRDFRATADLPSGVADGFAEAVITDASAEDRVGEVFHNGHWEVTGTLRQLLVAAYRPHGVMSPTQVVGGPDWSGTTLFRVHATMDPPAARQPDVRVLRAQMLRRLLSDRFGLDVRMDAAGAAVYELARIEATSHVPGVIPVECRLPAGIDPSEHRGAGACQRLLRPGSPLAQDIRMTDVASALADVEEIGRLVLDRTELTGAYDVNLQYSGGSLFGTGRDGVRWIEETSAGELTLAQALRRQLGLRLVESFDRVPVLTITGARLPATGEYP
jgi:uncharacterized protein (TIGR03435 family)